MERIGEELFEEDIPGLAAGLADEADVFDAHGLVDGLAHVVDGKGGAGDGGKGLHLDAGLASRADGGGYLDGVEVGVQAEVYLDVGEEEGMAHGDEVGGVLGGHDAGDSGHGENFALGDATFGDKLEGFGVHGNVAAGDGFALGVGLGANVDHLGPSLLIQMAQALHGDLFPLLTEDTFKDGQGVLDSPSTMAEVVLFVGWELGHGEVSAFGEEYGVIAKAAVSSTLFAYCTFTLASGVLEVPGGQGKGYDTDESGCASLIRDSCQVVQEEVYVVLVGAGACVAGGADPGGSGEGVDLEAGIIGEGGEAGGTDEGQGLKGSVFFIGIAGLFDVEGDAEIGGGEQVNTCAG